MTTSAGGPRSTLAELDDLARRLRTASPQTTSSTARNLALVLIGRHLRRDWGRRDDPRSDPLLCASPCDPRLFTAITEAVGLTAGHDRPIEAQVRRAGLPAALGTALAGRYLEGLPYRTWSLGDRRCFDDPASWEALEAAVHYRLDNLIVIVDTESDAGTQAHLGGPSRPAGRDRIHDEGWGADRRRRFDEIGAHVLTIDSSDLGAIDEALSEAVSGGHGRPTVVLATAAADRPVSECTAITGDLRLRGPRPQPQDLIPFPAQGRALLPVYRPGERVSSRRAFDDALAAYGGADPSLLEVDVRADGSGSIAFARAHPDRHFALGSPQSRLAAAAIGLSARGFTPIVEVCADDVGAARRVIAEAARADADLRLIGVAGRSDGGERLTGDGRGADDSSPDTPTGCADALTDFATVGTHRQAAILHPSDAVSTSGLLGRMLDRQGRSYLRVDDEVRPVLYPSTQTFAIGGSHTLRSSASDALTLVGSGRTVHAALEAAEDLSAQGVIVRVIDCYSIRPIDAPNLCAAAAATRGFVVAEDHVSRGGLGSAVRTALDAGGFGDSVWAHLAAGRGPESSKRSSTVVPDAEEIAAAALDLIAGDWAGIARRN